MLLLSAERKHSGLTWFVSGYVALIALWLCGRGLFFDRFWPLALINTIAEYLFVPLPFLLLASLWQRRWSAFIPLCLPLVTFLALFGELFWPLPLFKARADHHSPSLTAMTFNVLYSNQEYGGLARSIQAASPDLVGLQELTPPSAEALAGMLEADYPYSTLRPLESGRSVGLLSRYPLESVTWFKLPPLDNALHATIRLEGQRIHVFVVHLSPNNFFNYPRAEFIPLVIERYGRRAAEVTRLQEEVGPLNEPVVLLCDCNMSDTSEAYTRLQAFLRDSFREAGWGLGHTLIPPGAPFPVQRIDYVWHSAEFNAIEAKVGQEDGSDHLPVVAQLRLGQAE